jgi:coenzyme F420-reducing hydrogenase beta subunit
VCPFSDDAPDEDVISDAVFAGTPMHRDARTGRFRDLYAGRVNGDDSVAMSSSGGLTSWLAGRLLDTGRVTRVIHVGRSSSADSLFEERIADSNSDLLAHRKSHYYATTMAEALEEVRGSSERFALVGVPCFIKAARNLSQIDDDLRGKITFSIGLVCGHMKTQRFAESLAWQAGVSPKNLAEVDFRVKDPDKGAGDYSFGARAVGESAMVYRRTRGLVGGNWGHTAFQPRACDYCDDIFAETADVVFGDAWLPRFEKDWRGTNIVLSRSPAVTALLTEGAQSGAITLEPLSLDDLVASQAGNFRHRRDGLAVRLHDDKRRGLSAPQKRVTPSTSHVPRARVRLIRYRRRLGQWSMNWFETARTREDLRFYKSRMTLAIGVYRLLDGRLSLPALVARARGKLSSRSRTSR